MRCTRETERGNKNEEPARQTRRPNASEHSTLVAMTDNSEPPVNRKSRSLFHYTTAQGLLGIIKNRTLFATHSDFSNDSSECKLILPHLNKILAVEYEKQVGELIGLKIMSAEIFRDHGRAVFAKQAESTVKAMLQAVNNTAPWYITSFCIHGDKDYEYQNGLLSQWRSYARGGFAIEFDEHEIDELNKLEHDTWRYQGFITEAVVYENHETHVKPDQFKGMAGAFFRTLLSVDHPRFDEILGTEKIEDFGRKFLAVAPFLKHVGFKEEAEYRIVALCNRPTKSDPGDKRRPKEIHFRTRPKGDIVPYIALYDDLPKALAPRSVIVGPHDQQENQVIAVKLLLEQYQLDASVRVSEIPFRE
jgi:Protein of unknown function (DUF2971)